MTEEKAVIQVACPDDLAKLAEIERSAASKFREVNLAWIADGNTMPHAFLEAFCKDGTLWVAIKSGEPVGFLAAHRLDSAFFIAELSVMVSHQRQGIGASLIAAAVEHARATGFPFVTLTTYRNLPWNGPFYVKFGFSETSADKLGPEHLHKMSEEAKAGHDWSKRCAMMMRV